MRQGFVSFDVVLLLILLLLDVFVYTYDNLPLDSTQSCRVPYLRKRLGSGKHLAQLFYVFDSYFFNRTCVESPSAPTRNLWDTLAFRPYPKIEVFFHIGLFTHTAEVVDELVEAFDRSGLLAEANSFTIGLSGSGGVLPKLPSKFTVVGADRMNSHESITYGAIVRYVETHESSPQTVIFYLHSKGTYHRLTGSAAWRRYMMFFDIWLYRMALIMLQHYETYGVELHSAQAKDHFSTAHACYLGAFFWAKLSYMKHLDLDFIRRDSFFTRNRTVGELWIGTGFRLPMNVPVNRRMFCPMFSTTNHYVTEFGASKYLTYEIYRKFARFVFDHVNPSANISSLILPTMHCLIVMPSPYQKMKSLYKPKKKGK